MRFPGQIALLLISVWLVSSSLFADESQARKVSVGMTQQIQQIVLPGNPLVVKPLDRNSPIVIRIVETFPHGSDTRYDLEFYGLEPGTYDLSTYLQRADGTPATDLPSIPVVIESLLPDGQVTPHDLKNISQTPLGGYSLALIVGAVVWLLVLIAIIYWVLRGFYRPQQELIDEQRVPVAERLKPLVEAALSGTLDQSQQALLERTLVMFWRDRLDLHTTSAADALAQLRAHEEAGELLRVLEQWLHQPPQRRPQINVADLLAPYQQPNFRSTNTPSQATS